MTHTQNSLITERTALEAVDSGNDCVSLPTFCLLKIPPSLLLPLSTRFALSLSKFTRVVYTANVREMTNRAKWTIWHYRESTAARERTGRDQSMTSIL